MPPLYGQKIVIILLYENRTCPGKTGQLVTLIHVKQSDMQHAK